VIAISDEVAAAALLERFADFFDAVLVHVVLDLPRAAKDREAVVRLLAREDGGPWRSVVFSVRQLREFKIVEAKSSNLVLSDGLGIHFLNDEVLLDLAPFTERPVDAADLWRSHQYVVGKTCSVDVTDATD
jgi:hypothetical protein